MRVGALVTSNLTEVGTRIDLGGNPQGDRIGFRYWKEPGPMGKYLEETVGDNPLATFLGFWSVMGVYFLLLTPLPITHLVRLVNAMYSYVGIELVSWLIYATQLLNWDLYRLESPSEKLRIRDTMYPKVRAPRYFHGSVIILVLSHKEKYVRVIPSQSKLIIVAFF